MKQYLLIGSILMVFSGCEDVIEIDPPSEPPRLSVDALIRIDESEPLTTVVVNVGLTSSFFGDTQTAELDQITIQNIDYESSGPLDSNFVVLIETEPGRYEGIKNTGFFTSGTLQLSIAYENQRYLASTRYAPTVPIDTLTQGEGDLFNGDETEVVVAFTDNAERDDFYLFDFDFGEYLVTEDEFYPGQTFEFSYFYDDGVAAGRELDITILGVTEAFYNYMNQLIVQAGGDQGPFQTPAATVRGNLINVTNIDNVDSFDNVEDRNNFALGYFAVCQVFTESIVIE